MNNWVDQESYAGFHAKGGAIYSTKNLKLTGCVFDKNYCTGRYTAGMGGAVLCGADVDVNNCEFTNNYPGTFGNWYGDGAAIYAVGKLKASNSKFLGNTPKGMEAAIYSSSNDYQIINCIFDDGSSTSSSGESSTSSSGSSKTVKKLTP